MYMYFFGGTKFVTLNFVFSQMYSQKPICILLKAFVWNLASFRVLSPRGAQGARLDLEAESLIASATDPEELAQMYEPWRFWYEKR